MVFKREVLDLARATSRVLKIDLNDKENHLETNRMSLGTATNNLLKELSISSEKIMKFKNNVILGLSKFWQSQKKDPL